MFSSLFVSVASTVAKRGFFFTSFDIGRCRFIAAMGGPGGGATFGFSRWFKERESGVNGSVDVLDRTAGTESDGFSLEVGAMDVGGWGVDFNLSFGIGGRAVEVG